MTRPETVDAELCDPGLVRVHHYRERSSTTLDHDFWFSAENLDWVVEQLEQFLEHWAHPRFWDVKRGDDCFAMAQVGPDPDPVYRIQNLRPEGVPRPGTHTLPMKREAAEKLVADLKALRDG